MCTLHIGKWDNTNSRNRYFRVDIPILTWSLTPFLENKSFYVLLEVYVLSTSKQKVLF